MADRSSGEADCLRREPGSTPSVFFGSVPGEGSDPTTVHGFTSAPTREVVADAVAHLGSKTSSFTPGIVTGRKPDGTEVRALASVATANAAAQLLPMFETLEVITPEVLSRARAQFEHGEGDDLKAVERAASAVRSLAALSLNLPDPYRYPGDSPFRALDPDANSSIGYLHRLADAREQLGGEATLPRAAASLAETWWVDPPRSEPIPELSELRALGLLSSQAEVVLGQAPSVREAGERGRDEAIRTFQYLFSDLPRSEEQSGPRR